MKSVRVGLGERSYDILVGTGLIEQAGALMAPFLPRGRTTVVCDETVERLHGAALAGALKAHGIAASTVVMPPGEGTKSWQGLADLCDRLLAQGLDRGDVVTAFGGGVIGDLTGFAAAIYKRGIDFIQIPTTLLAQVDSSVGGKTAIDTPRGKNLIGAFHQPKLVLADLDVLGTLSRIARCARATAEIIKYGLLGDFAFFEWLERESPQVLQRLPDALAHAVARVGADEGAEIVGADVEEAAARALLNLGHTFGHALEAETGYGDTLLHGEAVAIGCAQAFRFSARPGPLLQARTRRAPRPPSPPPGLPVRMDQVEGLPLRRRRPLEAYGPGQEGGGRAPDLRAGQEARRGLRRKGRGRGGR